jgi:predicted N-acetyltransferase YhbS
METNDALAIKVRTAETTDAVTITKLINSAFRLAEGFFIAQDRIDLEGVVKLCRIGKFLLAESEGDVIGCVYVEPRDTQPARSYLGLLSVEPSRQQSGVGSFLMTAAEDYCRSAGSHFIDILVVNLREELPAFYRKRRYIETGTSPFPADIATKIPCHFIEMSKAL